MRNLLLIIGIVTIKGLSSAWAGTSVIIDGEIIYDKPDGDTWAKPPKGNVTIDAWPNPPKGNARVQR